MGLSIDATTKQFLDTGSGRLFGVAAKTAPKGRWQYRDADTGKLIASGISPSAFCAQFWFRADFQENV